MSWNWRYAGLIATSTIVDYVIGKKIFNENNKQKKIYYLITSLVVNLGILFFFKYFNFFVSLLSEAKAVVDFDPDFLHHELLLPVGISFYTFQTLSYTIDVYRGKLLPERNFLKFATYIAFFPQLVAGPIVRASHFCRNFIALHL